MTTISDAFESLKTIDIQGEAAGAIDDTKEEMKNIQRDQLLHGIKGDGKQIGKYRNRAYAAKKYAMNPLAGIGNVDLKLTGSVHNDIFVDVRDREFIIDSADTKMEGLTEKYGDPFGLTDENEAVYIEETLQDQFTFRMRNKTGL